MLRQIQAKGVLSRGRQTSQVVELTNTGLLLSVPSKTTRKGQQVIVQFSLGKVQVFVLSRFSSQKGQLV